MVKIDLHIHTVANKYLDPHFLYNSDFMIEYVTCNNVKVIAITNHNFFDKSNFEKVRFDLASIDCLVLPGIEISLENGHILVIGDESPNTIQTLENISTFISKKESDNQYSMSIDEFNSEVCSNDFLLIPHYLKKPSISPVNLEKIIDDVSSGEVKSRKHFVDLMESNSDLSPLLFSDIRIGLDSDTASYRNRERFTFIDIDDVTFSAIRRALSNKASVSLTEKGGNKLFDILGSRVMASTGINVLLGKRSSGKTYLLDSIFKSDQSSSLYIKQFQISNECEKAAFASASKNEQQPLIISFFKDFIDVLDYIDENNLDLINLSLSNYIDTLKKQAELNLKDVYSKTPLFNYEEIPKESTVEVEKLTNATLDFLSTQKEFKEEIKKYIDDSSLVLLFKWFVSTHKKYELFNTLIEETNDVAKQISLELSLKSIATPISDVDFSSLYRKLYIKQKFNNLVLSFKSKNIFNETVLGEFLKNVSVFKVSNKTTLKANLGVQKSAIVDYLVDCPPIEAYLEAKKDINIKNGLDNYRYRLFFDYQVKIIDKYGDDLSGGQTAEYLLLNKLIHYHDYDFVLIDEMESSFDNPFLNEKIVELIHNISKTCTVFISTHNNNLGVSLKPDYYIYHRKEKYEEDIQYKRFYGKTNSKYLVNHDGERVKLSEILIETMEANDAAYRERNKKYENSED